MKVQIKTLNHSSVFHFHDECGPSVSSEGLTSNRHNIKIIHSDWFTGAYPDPTSIRILPPSPVTLHTCAQHRAAGGL